jgi:hypothetical protein
VPIAPPVPFDPDACEKYPILQYGDRGFPGPGPVEITIYRTPEPDRHWIKHVVKRVVEYDPSGEEEEKYVESCDEVSESDAIRELRAAGFEVPPRLGAPRITASKQQRESGAGKSPRRLNPVNAERKWNAEPGPRRLDPASDEPRTIPQNAVMCTQAQVARFQKQAGHGGLIENLEKQGVLFWQTKRGGKYWVVFANDNQHAKFQTFVNREARRRRANRRRPKPNME